MARALVVYESMFGNTEEVAQAVAAGIREVMPVDVAEVGEPPDALDDFALVVLGGPTHAFSMSRASTRRDAREKGADHGSVGTGLREWLAELPPRGHPGWFATFDTRATKVRHLPGSAARSASRAARRHGLHELVDPESFYVVDLEGPLADGELDRARAWGRAVAAALPVPA